VFTLGAEDAYGRTQNEKAGQGVDLSDFENVCTYDGTLRVEVRNTFLNAIG
jgi:hypothetical protein